MTDSFAQQLHYLATDLLGWRYHDEAAYDDPQDGGKPLGRCKYYTKGSRVPTLRDLERGDGMIEIIEAMRARGWRCRIFVNGDCMAAFERTADEHEPDDTITFAQRTGLTLPEAVARAARSALKN